MSENAALIPVDQKEITFYGDELVAIRANDGHIYVSIRHLAEALGMTRQSQVRRVERQAILKEGYFKGAMMTPKGKRQANWLRVDLVPLFLTGIDTVRVKEEIRPKLEQYQKEAAKVLWEAFRDGRLTTEPSFEELLQSDSPAAQAYKMLQAMMQLARNQVLLEAKFQQHDETLADYGQRIEEIEASLSNEERYVSREQASRISQAVRGIGLLLTKQSGTSEYGRVYGELYRRFEISAYRELPAGKYDEAMKWLNEWRQSLVEESAF